MCIRDSSEDARKGGYLSCLSEIKGNGFPEETRHLMEQLSEPAFRQTLKEEYAAFWTAYQQDRDLLRFHYHRPRDCLLYTSNIEEWPFEIENVSYEQKVDKIEAGKSYEITYDAVSYTHLNHGDFHQW